MKLIIINNRIRYAFSIFKTAGKEEYADLECDENTKCNVSAKIDRPHLFGVGAPINMSERNETYNFSYDDDQSISHNVGIWVWGSYQVYASINFLATS